MLPAGTFKGYSLQLCANFHVKTVVNVFNPIIAFVLSNGREMCVMNVSTARSNILVANLCPFFLLPKRFAHFLVRMEGHVLHQTIVAVLLTGREALVNFVSVFCHILGYELMQYNALLSI